MNDRPNLFIGALATAIATIALLLGPIPTTAAAIKYLRRPA
jgi:hypothetical protein